MIRFAVLAFTMLLLSSTAWSTELGIIAFQMSSDTHARTANAAVEQAKSKGLEVTLLNSEGAVPKHAEQLDTLIQKGVDGILLAMGKTQQLETQLAAAQEKGIPVITVMSGSSPYTAFDVNVNEAAAGARIGMHLLGLIDYQGGLMMQRYEGHGGTRMRGRIMDVILEENTGVSLIGSHTMAKTKSWREDVRAGMEALLLKNRGKFGAIWTSFDGQAFVIDDLLREQGYKRGDVVLTGVDGGQEAFARIRDPESLFTATVAIPFEVMGRAGVDALARIIDGTPVEEITTGPFLYMDAVLVDSSNVPAEGEWPW
ncbi:MAG: substrate-binding domain-containing protein [Candidatus Competibacteraceae bacterium]|nr:substrate-binding domain-containing protein [Candidatus Competibacteraceae bacterium]